MSRTYSVALLFALLSALVGGRAEAVQRAHVATYGLDSNTSFGCSVANPCRFFQAATSVVDPNGEVVVLDSGAYGGVTLTQSVALIAPTGVYAGISVFPGATGVTIATPGINVVLRGVTINGQGGSYGLSMTAGASLSIENCVIANFSAAGNYAIAISTAAKVNVIDTLVRDSFFGIILQNGAVGAILRSTIVGSKNFGIYVGGNLSGATTSAAISDTTVSGGNTGLLAYSALANANVRVSFIRSTATNNVNYGIFVQQNAGSALLTLSESLVTGNGTGLQQAGAGATLESLGNNTVRQNNLNVSGTITTVAPL